MSEGNEFEDWSHPTRRGLSMPPRRIYVRAWVWWLLAAGFIAFCWYAAHATLEAYRVVFSS